MPSKNPRFSWLRPSVLWASRNDLVAKLFGDPIDRTRRGWVALQRENGVQEDFILDRSDLESISFLVAGDTGEGGASQYATIPPLQSAGQGAAFYLVASDVVYPAGDTRDYTERFCRPYQSLPVPIFAIPGNHDWYDGLAGFMRQFCGVAMSASKGRELPRPMPLTLIGSLLWRNAQPADPRDVAEQQTLRPPNQGANLQPGPYFVIDTGPLRIVGIDTGITGRLDAEQGLWLKRVSAGLKPKLLVTGKPLFVDGKSKPGTIEGGGTVLEIVHAPENRYVAVIAGDIHNYQHYPVPLPDGRTIHHLVAGGGGAFMHATHRIDRVDVAGVSEGAFRCYPLRGDSLAAYSRAYEALVGKLLRPLGIRLPRGWLTIPEDQAVALMSERIGITPVRPSARNVRISRRSRWLARVLIPLPSRTVFQKFLSEILAWDEPPFFKSFIRVDVSPTEMRLRCLAATGCGEHEQDPPVEDEIRIDLAAIHQRKVAAAG